MPSRYPLLPLLFLFAAATGATAMSSDIKAGASSFLFSFNISTAIVGETLVFQLRPSHHNPVQVDFDSSLPPSAPGFYLHFINSVLGVVDEVFTATINETRPIWIYDREDRQHRPETAIAIAANLLAAGDTITTPTADAQLRDGSTPAADVGSLVVSSNSDTESSFALPSNSSMGSSPSSSARPSPNSGSTYQLSVSASTGATTSQTLSISSIFGKNLVLSAITAILAVLAFWIGLV